MRNQRNQWTAISITMLIASGSQPSSAEDMSNRNAVHVVRPTRPTRPPDPNPDNNNAFSRMFPELPSFAPSNDAVREQASKLGAKGGVIDALDNVTDPTQSIANAGPRNPDNPAMTAGMTFLGQFIDHDLTLALKAPLRETTDPRRTENFRTAAFDLDQLYGDGPGEDPELYDASSGDFKFRVVAIPGSQLVSRKGAVRYDLPRDANNNALIADSRDDENVVISQLHMAMMKFHNAVVERLRADPQNARSTPRKIFAMAQRQVRWHYQWIILHEYLPLTIGQDRVDAILKNGPRFYRVNNRGRGDAQGARNARNEPQIPIEFSVAAFRFGHSQVRPSYRLNFGPDGGPSFVAPILDDTIDPANPDPADLRGGKRAARRFVDWQTFFKFDADNFRLNKRIDTKISSALFQLPGSRGLSPGLPSDGVQSLASRNLMRHVNYGIPSGQAIARTIGVPVLAPSQLAELVPYGMEQSTPLWYYILKESELVENGTRLGPVGSLIVGEVLIGLLKADDESYLSARKNWTPDLPSAQGGQFGMTDLLKFAGVVPPLQ
ncbi:heme peroxidase family protein [Actimicrobium antarcticum]|uniref:Heme peroxidase family protein n=1 Tax=Actimicrobium antarcticum TaxID=1051899 RepID=A0ABP7SQ60_9BURK